MSQTCPVCGRPVDPLRARSVGVRDGKIVAYDTLECARAAETKPTVMPAPLAAAVAAAEQKPNAEAAKPKAEAAKPEPKAEAAKPEPKAEVAKPKPEPKPAPKPAAAKPEPTAEVAKPTPKPAAGPTRETTPAPPPEEVSEAKSGRAGLAIALVVVLGGAGAFLAYRYLISPAKQEPAPTKQVMTTPLVAIDAAPPDAPQVTAADAVAKARDVLEHGLTDGTPRVQRVAAAALARTGDSDAIALLADALAKETVDAAKLELAYGLARGGDKRGTEALVAALGSGRRDTKLEAGRRLAQLGDQRAIRTLENYLDVVQLRLGTAEVLANLAEPRAIEALTKIRAAGSEKISHDEWARATIALGIAGRTDVVTDLHQLLEEDGFKPFAASALARLRDPAARPVLVGLLAFPSLRVEAARSLRVLDPAADTAAERTTLLAALSAEKDTVQLQVAEALLLLAGDPAWSEHP